MRLATTVLTISVTACSNAQNVPVSESYSLLLQDDGQTWCGYKDAATFEAEAATKRPTETARITYSANTLTELMYQVEAESGDWIVVDNYTPTDGGLDLRRANLLAQEDLQVIQETAIRADEALPFRVVSVSTLRGEMAELPDNLDFPEVGVRTNLSASPEVKVVDEIRSRSLEELCRKPD